MYCKKGKRHPTPFSLFSAAPVAHAKCYNLIMDFRNSNTRRWYLIGATIFSFVAMLFWLSLVLSDTFFFIAMSFGSDNAAQLSTILLSYGFTFYPVLVLCGLLFHWSRYLDDRPHSFISPYLLPLLCAIPVLAGYALLFLGANSHLNMYAPTPEDYVCQHAAASELTYSTTFIRNKDGLFYIIVDDGNSTYEHMPIGKLVSPNTILKDSGTTEYVESTLKNFRQCLNSSGIDFFRLFQFASSTAAPKPK